MKTLICYEIKKNKFLFKKFIIKQKNNYNNNNNNNNSDNGSILILNLIWKSMMIGDGEGDEADDYNKYLCIINNNTYLMELIS
jgi:hypothetical protein